MAARQRVRKPGSRPAAAFLTLLALILIAVSLVVSTAVGSSGVDVGQAMTVVLSHIGIGGPPPTHTGFLDPRTAADTIVWELRMPRGLLAVIVGAGLATSGVAMQTLVRNPLADPYLLGISAGAGMGATAVLIFGFMGLGLQLGALAGALIATATVFGISMAQGGLSPLRLVLTGVVLSAAFSAASSFLVFIGPDSRAAESVMFWMLGSVGGAKWGMLWAPALAVVIAFVALMTLGTRMDALATGPDTAAAVGINVHALRLGLFLIQGLLVGLLVAAAGGIGFVGLVIPHAARILIGARHRILLPVAAAFGGLFLLWVDMVARIVAAPQEMPLGVVTGLVGAPIFLILMGRGTYRYGGAQ